jgi:hypothetical protein
MLAGNAQMVQQRASQVALRRLTIWGKARRQRIGISKALFCTGTS